MLDGGWQTGEMWVLEVCGGEACRLPCVRPGAVALWHYRKLPMLLATPERAAFIGSKVDKQVVHERTTYHRKRIEGGGQPLY